MRKHFVVFIISVVVILAVLYVLLLKTLPKTASYFPVLVFLFVMDLYLWDSYRHKVQGFRSVLRLLIRFLYWVPYAAYLISLFLSVILSPEKLNSGFQIYMTGVIISVYAAKLIPVVLLLVSDMIRLIRWVTGMIKGTGRRKTITRSKILRYAGLAAGLVILILFMTGMVKWASDFRVRKETVYLSQLPESFEGLRIVQISDLHLGSWTSKERLKEAVNTINELKPDLVLFTGDLVNFITEEAYPFEDILKMVHAPYGVFPILGNHDYGIYVTWETEDEKKDNMEELVDYYKRIGWDLLRNENRKIVAGDDTLALIGAENWSIYDRYPTFGDLDKSLVGVENIPFKILLSHDPTHWEYVVTQEYPDIDLTLSGHTHAFQMGIETSWVRWSPSQYLYDEWAGLYAKERSDGTVQYLYVTRGIGNIGYPGRIGILPEITLIELRVNDIRNQ